MSISFAGVAALLESGMVAQYFDRALPRDWHNEHCDSLSAGYFNYPWPPHLIEQLRIGELYWPTGAQRFAQCWLLATEAKKDAILAALGSGGSGSLVMDNGGTSITAAMYLLPPKKLAVSDELWLLPLVDQRYWWQYASTKDQVVIAQGTTTWADLVEDLATELSATITTSTIPSEYLFPDTETLTRYGGRPAELLDGVAHSIGMRVVAHLNGDIVLQSPGDGITALTANRAITQTLRAGGAFDVTARALPEALSVVFRQRNFSTNEIRGAKVYSENAPGSVPADSLLAGRVKRINSTCYADVTIAGFDSTPDNDSALSDLVEQMALDYYHSLSEQYESRLNTFINWEPCFYDDYVLWYAGGLYRQPGDCFDFEEDECAERTAGVRVRSYPVNFGPDYQFQQGSFPLTPGYPPPTGPPIPPPPGYPDLETWKRINIDDTLADDYGLTVCYGPFDLTTFSNDAAVGTKAWDDAGDAETDGGGYASNYDLVTNGQITNYLKALQMAAGYTPDVAFVPKVVHVTIDRRNTGDPMVKDSEVKLVVGGTVQADNQAAAVPWPADDGVMRYRFLTTASRADTLAADFGVVLAAQYTGESDPTTSTQVLNDSAPAPSWAAVYGNQVIINAGATTSSELNTSVSGNPRYSLTGADGIGISPAMVGSVRSGFGYTPSVSGELVNVSGSVDVAPYGATVTGTLAAVHIVLTQDGNLYTAQIASGLSLGPNNDTLTNYPFTLVPGDFTKQSGAGPATPDFTAAGDQMLFGFATSVAASTAWTLHFDNFVVNVVKQAGTVNGGEAAVDHIQIRICGTV